MQDQGTSQEVSMSETEETVDPFLNVDFAQGQTTTAPGMPSGNINADQRVALASGNLDEAIALGNRGQV